MLEHPEIEAAKARHQQERENLQRAQKRSMRLCSVGAMVCGIAGLGLLVGALMTIDVKVADHDDHKTIHELELEIAVLKAAARDRQHVDTRTSAVQPLPSPGEPDYVERVVEQVTAPTAKAEALARALADHDWSYVDASGQTVTPPTMPAGHPPIEKLSPMSKGWWTLTHTDGSRAASVEVTFTDPTGVLLPETVTSSALGEVDVPEAFLSINFQWESEPRFQPQVYGKGLGDGRQTFVAE